jgi:hypothetical protein
VLHRELEAGALALCIVLGAWAGHARAQGFSSTSPVIAILEGELLLGEATGHLGGWGTIALRAPSKDGRTCAGEFSYSDAAGDAGQLKCSDGARAAFWFQRLSMMRGYGAARPGGSALSFTYGLSAEDSAPYLQVPAGKALSGDGGGLVLVGATPFPSR